MVNLNVRSTPEGIMISGLRGRLQDPRAFMDGVGKILVAGSQKAFREQRFGATIWPKRYPDQTPPKLNVAGALADAIAGKSSPKANRFNDTPAGVDTQELKNSVAYRTVGNDAIIFGSPKKYATRVQAGGVTIQRITETARKTIAGWLKRARGAVRNLRSGGTNKEIRAQIDRFLDTSGPDSPKAKKLAGKLVARATRLPGALGKLGALSKLGWMLARPKAFEPLSGSPGEVVRTGRWKFDTLTTKVAARPYAGLTAEIREKIIRFGTRWFEKGR